MDISELYQIYQKHPVITTDSRDCPEGSIFLALKGASFDGNKFAAMALEKGCAYAIVDEKEYAQEGNERFILVEDCLTTFKELAREHRRHFNIPVVGITGTNGKTTTKELVSAVLGEKYNVMFTQGNFNNDVGVPKTLFRLAPEHEIAVVEMGASHPGDIKKLVEYVEPTCGMITNVGRAHLQGFGSFEGVKKTKGELYDFLAASDALVFINADNEHLMEMADQRNINRLITYGKEDSCDVWGEVISCAPFLKFRWRTESFDWHEVQTHANPSSMAAAIENFRVMDVPQKMAILGQMGELGEVSHEEHQKVVDQLQAAGLENVWLVGDEFQNIPCQYRKFHDVEEVKAAIKEAQPHDHYILIKGSNSVKLFQLPELL